MRLRNLKKNSDKRQKITNFAIPSWKGKKKLNRVEHVIKNECKNF